MTSTILILGCIINKNIKDGLNANSIFGNHNESHRVDEKLNNSQIISTELHNQSLVKPSVDFNNSKFNKTDLKVGKRLRYKR